jgi:hypothetical protein
MSLLAINAKLYYRSAGIYGAPTFTAIDIVENVAVNPVWDEGAADSRESRVHQFVKTMLGLEVTFRLKKKPTNAAYIALMNALVGDTVIDFLVMDGAVDVVGNRGWRFDAQVFNGSEDQALANVLYQDMVIKPYPGDNPTKAVLVGAGPALTYSIPGANGGSFA